MNLFIEYMSFDVSWFITTPGLLVTAGLILVIIGAVMALFGGKTKDVATNEEVSVANETSKEEKTNISDTVTNETIAIPSVEKVEETVVVPTVENKVEESTPIVSDTAETVIASIPNNEAMIETENTIQPIAVEEVITQDELPTESMNESVEVLNNPVVENTPVNDQVSIYGGVSPQVAVNPIEEPRKAYGGADPLENTGALPRVEVPTVSESPIPSVADIEVSQPVVEPVNDVLENKPENTSNNADVEILEF